MRATLRVPALALIGTLALAGCATDNMFGGTGSSLTTASVPETPKVDPACVSLSAQIDNLRKEGITAKIEKAAQKKAKLTPADAAKADQLNKANADFQARCSTISPRQAAAPAPSAPAAAVGAASVASAAKATGTSGAAAAAKAVTKN